MIHDADALTAEPPRHDVVIVGSGPAGMTVAAELAGSGCSVAVLESGRRRPTRYGDDLRVVTSDGITIKDYSRERVLGGASTTWSGLSSPLDPIDLAPRPWLRHSGWPLERDELLPYYQRAADRYRFAGLERFAPGGFDALRARCDTVPDWSSLEEKVFLAAAEPQDFGAEWVELCEGDQVDLYLDATVVELLGSGREVQALSLRTRSGKSLRLEAGRVVLATGGIENARLLLASTGAWPAGLGNAHDQVGRYFMNHPKNYHGTIRLARPVREMPYYFGCLHEGYAGYGGLRLTEELQEELGVLNSYVRFEPLFPWTDNRGVEAFVLFVKRSAGLMKRWKERRRGKVVSIRDYSETGDDSDLQNARKGLLDWVRLVLLVVVNLPMVARYVASRLREGRAPTIREVRLRNFMEMEPDPDNRVVLGDERDAHGRRRPRVRHDTTALDRRSLTVLHEVLGQELEQNGLGALDSDLARAEPWPIDLDASHHMGTTRMGRDPATSVVDPEGRLHEADNVYLAGASVFPTSGCANPTFTLVALAIRLADRLKASGAAP